MNKSKMMKFIDRKAYSWRAARVAKIEGKVSGRIHGGHNSEKEESPPCDWMIPASFSFCVHRV